MGKDIKFSEYPPTKVKTPPKINAKKVIPTNVDKSKGKPRAYIMGGKRG